MTHPRVRITSPCLVFAKLKHYENPWSTCTMLLRRSRSLPTSSARRSVVFVKINEIYSAAFSGSVAVTAVVEAPSAAGASLDSPAAGPPSVEA